jgi:2-enoate reductase
MKKEHEILFDKIKIGSLELKNRFVMCPMGPAGLCDDDGCFTENGRQYYIERAKGGTGLIITGTMYIEEESEIKTGEFPFPQRNPEKFTRTNRQMTDEIHKYGSKIFAQLTAGFGRVGIPNINTLLEESVGPSPIPHRWVPEHTVRPLTIDQIKSIINSMGIVAKMVKEAGFDGVEIHAVHEGYLLDQFATSFWNQRTDEYGGSLENRLRFATEIVKEIKEVCGQDFPVILRYSSKHFIKGNNQGAVPGEEFEEKGRDVEEGIEAAKILEAAGYDAFDADLGCYDSWYWPHPPMYQPKGLYLPYNEKLKKVLKVPVITAGRMDNPDLASDAVRSGKTDFIGLARPLLADANLPNKIQTGEYDDIRTCLSCQDACIGGIEHRGILSCTLNPTVGHEKEWALKEAENKKKIMVIGGGVAGLEFARVARLRGHEVALYEKTNELGGNLKAAGAPSFKEDDRELIRWYTNQMKKLEVKVSLGVEVNADLIAEVSPDEVIVATGSLPKVFNVQGGKLGETILVAQDVLTGVQDTGNSTVIVGGGLVGCELALDLINKGKKVAIVEALPALLASGAKLCSANSQMLKDLLNFHEAGIYTNAKLLRMNDEGVVVATEDGEIVIPADTIILSVGYCGNNALYEEIKDNKYSLHVLGDANKVANIQNAVWGAFELARNI